jgi:hypothetical protein
MSDPRILLIEEYFHNPRTAKDKPHTPEQDVAARVLLSRVNRLLIAVKWPWLIDPDTGSCISGAKGGDGDGGFRLPDSTTGAPGSQHRKAHAVDVYDPKNELDNLLTDIILAEYGLYREHPDSTLGWCHLQDVAPGSGYRTYRP